MDISSLNRLREFVGADLMFRSISNIIIHSVSISLSPASTFADPGNNRGCAIWQGEMSDGRPPQGNSRTLSIASSLVNASVDPNGDTMHQLESVESGHFSFEVGTTGHHTACFWSPRFELSASVSVDVEWKLGFRARNPHHVTAKGKLEVSFQDFK